MDHNPLKLLGAVSAPPAPIDLSNFARMTMPRRAFSSLRLSAAAQTVTARRFVFMIFVALAVVATVQRGVLTNSHATFPIFRQSFVHLAESRDLYAPYPAEQGPEDRDLFKYNPSAALAFAPLTLLPFLAGLLAWTLINALGVYAAMRALFPEEDATAALLIVFPALIAAVQSTSSNGLVAALMIGGFVSLEAGRHWRAAAAVAIGILMKLFPAAMLPLFVLRANRGRVAVRVAIVLAALLSAPLLVTAWPTLVAQYKSWFTILPADEGDLVFARSIMVAVRSWTGVPIANWIFQLTATLVLLAPLAVRRSSWDSPAFRRGMFASLMVYVVIFNHQSENGSYVIAAVGLAIWFLSARATPARVLLLLACLAGLEAVPYFLVWGWMQVDLLLLPERVRSAAEASDIQRADELLPEYEGVAA